MFHIKTDIRQYKCESAEKVERLIRNWVIRPSDLIYNADQKSWHPIGQHPAFDEIFAGIEHEEANEPDTLVTEAPSEVGAEHEVEPGTELEAQVVNGVESTNVGPAPGAQVLRTSSTVIVAKDATLAADSEEITNVTEAPAEPSAKADVSDEETTDVREDPRRDTDEQDAADAPAPTPPEPSEEVEGLVRDSDEITMMTDKTFEMLSEETRNKDAKAEASEPDKVADDVSEEPEAPALDEAAEQMAADGGEASVEEEEACDASVGGRHGLPEEVFVTDEIPRQNVQQAVLDELGELEEDSEPIEADDEVTEITDRGVDESGERKSRWRIVMSDDQDEVFGAPEDSDESEEPDESEGPDEPQGRDEPVELDEQSDATRTDGDVAEAETPGEDASVEAQADAPEEPRLEDAVDDDDLDEMLDEAAELVGLGEDSEPIDIDGGALEALEEDDEDAQEVRERADTPVRAPVEPKMFISEGYKLPLPVDISPSPEDIRLGLVHSRVGKAAKDATFPYPKPKKPDEVASREFNLESEEPADHSILIVAAFFIGVLIIVLGAVTIFG